MIGEERPQFLVGLRRRRPGADTRDHVELVGYRPLERLVRRGGGHGRDGGPRLGAARVVEPGRHHADDQERLLVDEEAPADDIRGAAVAALPDAVTDHERARRAGDVVRGSQRASEDRRCPEHLEEGAGDVGHAEVAGAAALDHRNRAGAVPAHARRAVQRAGAPAQRVHFRRFERHVRAARTRLPPHDQQPSLVAHRQRPQQHAVDQRVHGGARGDAQHEREDGRGGAAAALPQVPTREPQLLA